MRDTAARIGTWNRHVGTSSLVQGCPDSPDDLLASTQKLLRELHIPQTGFSSGRIAWRQAAEVWPGRASPAGLSPGTALPQGSSGAPSGTDSAWPPDLKGDYPGAHLLENAFHRPNSPGQPSGSPNSMASTVLPKHTTSMHNAHTQSLHNEMPNQVKPAATSFAY